MTYVFTSQFAISLYDMALVAVAWIYVVLMMALAEATSSNGTVLGAVFTFLLYGVLPLAIVMYVMLTPARRRRRRAEEEAASATVQPDGGDHAAGDAVAPERKEP
ncbi:hypothetical protein [Piscinibacter sp.]|uniref:hypothetical protein n=1 Tax=Piscinibacter sp. TaxID=1903157 RepID=UPI00391F6A6D